MIKPKMSSCGGVGAGYYHVRKMKHMYNRKQRTTFDLQLAIRKIMDEDPRTMTAIVHAAIPRYLEICRRSVPELNEEDWQLLLQCIYANGIQVLQNHFIDGISEWVRHKDPKLADKILKMSHTTKVAVVDELERRQAIS